MTEKDIIDNAFCNNRSNESYQLELRLLVEIRDLLKSINKKQEFPEPSQDAPEDICGKCGRQRQNHPWMEGDYNTGEGLDGCDRFDLKKSKSEINSQEINKVRLHPRDESDSTTGAEQKTPDTSKSKESKIADEINKDYDDVCEKCGIKKGKHIGVGLRWTCADGREFKPKCVKTKRRERNDR